MLTVKRKVQFRSTSRYLAVTKLIPEDWHFVKLTLISQHPGWVTIAIEKLE